MVTAKKQKLVQENPFYGLKSLFALHQNQGNSNTASLITPAWNESKSEKERRELFHVINFATGDIANRQHNLFGKTKVESGGNSANEQWIVYLKWLLNNNEKQFINFLPLMVEYVGLRELTTYQIKTQKGKNKTTGTWGLLRDIQAKPKVYNALLELLVTFIDGNNPFNKTLVAKFVKIPRYSKRQAFDRKTGSKKGTRKLLSDTVYKMEVYHRLVNDLSAKKGWGVTVNEKFVEFTGYRNWQKQYNKDFEFVLFSTNKILDFDQEQFTNWLNVLPSGGRFAVRRRLLTKENKVKNEKWSKLSKWFLDWEKAKETLQQTQRVLEEKAKNEGLNHEEQETLKKVKKEAKVTTGASNLFKYIDDFVNGNVNDVTIQSILDKVVFDVPVLPIIDCSGSMSGRPTQLARLMTTLILTKNPSSHENVLFTFGTHASVYSDGSTGTDAPNRFMKGKSTTVINKLIDRTDTFMNNFNKVSMFVNSNQGGTNFSGIPEKMREWVNSASDEETKNQRKEQILEYPVFLLVSDGDLNNSTTPTKSFIDFQMKMKQWFGWEGVVILWNVPKYGDGASDKSDYLENVENVIHLSTYNLSTINQVFTKINDIDIIDVYTSLKSLYESNRYNPVKMATL
jgi:hypothetical protein